MRMHSGTEAPEFEKPGSIDLAKLLAPTEATSGGQTPPPLGSAAKPTGIEIDCSDSALGRPVWHVVVRLMSDFTDSPESCRELMGRLDLRFTGLPAGTMPYTSERVRQYLRAIHEHWPYWIHFLKPSRENLTTLLFLLSDPIKPEKKQAGSAESLLDEKLQIIDRMFVAGAEVQKFSNCPETIQRAHVRRVLETLRKCMAL